VRCRRRGWVTHCREESRGSDFQTGTCSFWKLKRLERSRFLQKGLQSRPFPTIPALTITTRQDDKHRFQRQQPYHRLRESIPALLEDCAAHEQNVIVRPHSARAVFIQLDDLKREAVGLLKPAAFLSLHTSPGNYQAWVALKTRDCDKDFARRLRKRAGADDTASGATRVAGSLNFKDKYAPDFPRVEISHVTPGLITDTATLEKLGLVTAPEQPAPASFRVSPPRSDNRKWPSYDWCVQGAPENRDKTRPDVSRADFTWCMTAITWGFPMVPERSSPSRVRFAAPNNGVPLTAPGRSEANRLSRGKGSNGKVAPFSPPSPP
jgi:hypothetical protein